VTWCGAVGRAGEISRVDGDRYRRAEM